MRIDDDHLVRLTTGDLMTLRAGLAAYLREFAQHREQDGGLTHSEQEWQSLKRQVGQLLWRLEEAGRPAGGDIVHSELAVPPEQE